MRSDIPNRFVSLHSAFVITAGYSLVYLADANPYCMLHLHVIIFFLQRIHYAVFEQPVTDVLCTAGN
jgi:hypothetical protein